MKYKVLLLLLLAALLTGCANTSQKNSSKENTSEVIESSEDASPTPAANPSSEESSKTAETEDPNVYVLTFQATTVDGIEMTSDVFSDSKLTMINVWATYCNPCLSEMPDLGEIANEYDPSTFQMIGIISDVAENDTIATIDTAKALIEETKADYPHLLLNQSLYRNLVGGISGVPTTFFFNQESELLGYLVGAQSKDVWIRIIEDLLSQME